ncbi:MAG: sugar phosphate isomerase/epimerase [Chloroflexi bacterium]|nr:sugar phosphate isomerase/epimerase [Chloroflexota bacterium]
MIFGAITNSWRNHLAEQGLAELIAEAEARGSGHVELRQTCLGDCESGQGDDWRPNLPGLQSITDQFPALQFDLAMALPCLSGGVDPKGEQFQMALQAAKIVGREAPHLRLVDPDAAEAAWQSAGDIPESALDLANLAREAAAQGVTLSLENSGQPIGSMALLVEECRKRLSPQEGTYLGLCPDPTNQLRRFPGTDPLGDLDALPLDMLKIVHFKQARNGDPHPSVDTGDLDCGEMLRLLEAKNYQGPAIMEIPPHPDVFENLSHSYEFLNAASGR